MSELLQTKLCNAHEEMLILSKVTADEAIYFSRLDVKEGTEMGAAPAHIVQLQIMNLPKPKNVQVYSILSEGHTIAGLDSRTKRKQSGKSCWQQSSAQTPGRYWGFEAWKLLC